jgi:uncharacterized protein
MARPKKERLVKIPPIMEGFKPFGIPIKELEPVVLFFEEYESIRLADYEGLTQEQAAEEMRISRPTFTRIYEKARQSVAEAFIEGKAIFFEGGRYYSDDFWYKCESCLKLSISKTEKKRCLYCKSESIRRLNK